MNRALDGKVYLAVPLVLVNLAAIWGQAGWAYTHFGQFDWNWVVAILFALAIETIGIYLAYEAHEALMADQASAMLRFGSYLIGILAGILNYLHFAPTNPAQAWAFAGLSAISPWLWGIWSRARNRARLAELGLIDPRGVKLSTSRKLWHPLRSIRVVRDAAWSGITDPKLAVAAWDAKQVPPIPALDFRGTSSQDQRVEITRKVTDYRGIAPQREEVVMMLRKAGISPRRTEDASELLYAAKNGQVK